MSDPFNSVPLGLVQQRAAHNIDPEQLEFMGKKAAAYYDLNGGTLSNAVVETVKQALLSPEQVKRVCEFANTNAFLSEFEKGGSMRNVTFPEGPANPSTVLKDLNDGSSPAVHQVKTAGYEPPKSHYKFSLASDDILMNAFGAGSMVKVSQEQSLHANPIEDVVDLKIRLESMRNDFISKYASSSILLMDVKDALCSAVRQEIMEGSNLGDIVTAWSSYSPDVSIVKEATQTVGRYLNSTGTLLYSQQMNSLTKMASSGTIPNPNHPVMDHFIAFTKISHEHRKLQEASEIVEDELAKVNLKFKGLV